jgi:hypothetical protein
VRTSRRPRNIACFALNCCPHERETREALHLDHDRKGVSGSPDLASTIFKQIEQAAVFVADVTLVGGTKQVGGKAEGRTAKRLINSNVAIEYGYAHHALGDARILMVQNRYFGERDDLPFDLKHKVGPIQYSLAADASTAQIDREKARLRGDFVIAATLQPAAFNALLMAPPMPRVPPVTTATLAMCLNPSGF